MTSTATEGAPPATDGGASSPRPDAEQVVWDAQVAAASGRLLQSWRWGAFKERHGWRAERIRVETADGAGLAQVLFKHRGPVSVGYLPRGPVLAAPDGELARRLFRAVDEVAVRHGALCLIVEPEAPLPFTGRYRDAGFVRGPEHIQPERTVKVPLLDDEGLLAQMHPKMRYNVRLAQRRGVVARRAEPDASGLSTFHGLMADTAARNAYAIHAPDYYGDFLRLFGDDAVLLFAVIDGLPVATVIAARFGDEAQYMYGASSTRHRAHGAGFFLQFEAMRWARERGCRRYDLWGIPAKDPPSTEDAGGERLAGTRGDDWRGLYEFKVRFGGEVVSYPPALERRYRPLLATLARRLYRPGA